MSTYLGQNFLIDSAIKQRIVQTIQTLVQSRNVTRIIEIGPGKGALTKHIVDICPSLLCIEKDETMKPILDTLQSKHSTMNVMYTDVLEWIVPQEVIDHNTLIVGNLPYYITSPILRKFFEEKTSQRAGGVFLIQKEVAEKVMRNAPKKSFLRWLINYSYHVEYCFSVSPKAFNPPPKVTSAVIRLIPKGKEDIPSIDFGELYTFLDLYSSYKRKTLSAANKIIKKHNNSDREYNIASVGHQRLEELGRDDMETILS